MSKDNFCNPPADTKPLCHPSILSKNLNLTSRLIFSAHNIGLLLLERFSQILGLPTSESLGLVHRKGRASTSALGILKYEKLSADCPLLGHSAHTDVGTLTLLFCHLGGLQFLPPNKEEWEFIEPRPGHAIVNVGDSLRFLSGKRLASCLHRVVPLMGGTVAERYSCAYFMRPEMDVVLVDEEGESWRSLDWHVNKYSAFRAPLDKQMVGSVMTGKSGFVGLWEGN